MPMVEGPLCVIVSSPFTCRRSISPKKVQPTLASHYSCTSLEEHVPETILGAGLV